jgi:hypothetical protein
MSAQDPGIFWYKVSLTLRSPLTPEQVREQLSKAPPLFDVDTGHPVSRVPLFFNRGRIFSLRLREGGFHVRGPFYCGEGSPCNQGVDVYGSVEPADQESFIHLTVFNGAVANSFFFGLVLIALLVCAVALDFFELIVYGGVPLTLVGIISYPFASIVSRSALKRLVLCLENMLSAQRTL